MRLNILILGVLIELPTSKTIIREIGGEVPNIPTMGYAPYGRAWWTLWSKEGPQRTLMEKVALINKLREVSH